MGTYENSNTRTTLFFVFLRAHVLLNILIFLLEFQNRYWFLFVFERSIRDLKVDCCF